MKSETEIHEKINWYKTLQLYAKDSLKHKNITQQQCNYEIKSLDNSISNLKWVLE